MRPPFPPPLPQVPQVLPGYARPPRRSAVPLVAGLFGMIAAGLTLGGSFAPVREVKSGESGYVIKWWGIDRPDVAANTDTLAGLTLVLATLLLGVGAVVAFTRVTAAARLFLALGTASLAGTVLLQVIYTIDDLSLWNDVPLEPGESVKFTAGWGLWLPLAAVVFGAVAVVLAYRGGPARVEPNTPRMGFPMPYGPPTGTQPAVPGALTPPGAVPAGMPAGMPMAGVPMGVPLGGAPAASTTPAGVPAAGPVAMPPAAAPVAAAPVAPPAPVAPSTSDDPDETLRTTVSEAPAAVPAPAAPGASAAAAAVPEPPAADEIASALTPAPDAPTEIPPADSAEWTAADVDTLPEPASDAADAPTEVPAAEPATEPAPLDSAAASTEPDDVTSQDATPEPATDTAPATGEPAGSAESAEPSAERPAPEPGASGLSGLPAAPPAPELAAEQEER
jgi:hypothetical protein